MIRDHYQDTMAQAFDDQGGIYTFIVYNRYEHPSIYGGLDRFLEEEGIKGVTIHSVPEGIAVSGDEVLATVTGSFKDCTQIESCLLHYLNTVSPVATRARDYIDAANYILDVMDFSLRRSPNPMLTSYGAMLGGIHKTSNVDAAKLFDMEAVGTMSHAWVMAHKTEGQAFSNWPGSSYLIDTYDVKEAFWAAKDECAEVVRLDMGYSRSLPYIQWIREQDKEIKIAVTGDLSVPEVEALAASAQVQAVGIGTGLVKDLPNIGYVFKLHKFELNGDVHYRQKTTKGVSPSFSHSLYKVFD